MENVIPGLTVNTSNENFATWAAQSFVSDDLRSILQEKSILLVPEIGFRDRDIPVFPVGTENLLEYFQKNAPANYSIDICVNEDLYAELSLHHDYIRLGRFLVKEIALPVFIGLLTAYITENYIKHEDSKPKVEIIDNSTHQTIINPPAESKPSIEKAPPKKYLAPPKLKFSVTIVDSNGASKEYHYDGPVKNVKEVTEEIKTLWKNDKNAN